MNSHGQSETNLRHGPLGWAGPDTSQHGECTSTAAGAHRPTSRCLGRGTGRGLGGLHHAPAPEPPGPCSRATVVRLATRRPNPPATPAGRDTGPVPRCWDPSLGRSCLCTTEPARPRNSCHCKVRRLGPCCTISRARVPPPDVPQESLGRRNGTSNSVHQARTSLCLLSPPVTTDPHRSTHTATGPHSRPPSSPSTNR